MKTKQVRISTYARLINKSTSGVYWLEKHKKIKTTKVDGFKFVLVPENDKLFNLIK